MCNNTYIHFTCLLTDSGYSPYFTKNIANFLIFHDILREIFLARIFWWNFYNSSWTLNCFLKRCWFCPPKVMESSLCHESQRGPKFADRFLAVCDNYNLKSHKCACITIYQQVIKYNPNPNPNLTYTTKQHAIATIPLNIVTCPMYPDKFIRDTLLHRLCDLRL